VFAGLKDTHIKKKFQQKQSLRKVLKRLNELMKEKRKDVLQIGKQILDIISTN
jgi:hypothetical protein